MRGHAESITFLRPRTLEQALDLYAKNPKASVLAGGTDFMVLYNAGFLNGRTVLDISGLKELKGVKILRHPGENRGPGPSVLIGSLVTHTQIQKNPIIQKQFPLLVQACATVGAAQIQNRGTLGGNIANASPAGDTFPALAVYEAQVHAVSIKGRRRIAFMKMFAGVKKTTLEAGELIEFIEIPFLKTRPTRQFFRKVGTRAAQAISKTVGAGILWKNKKGAVESARISFGSVAPTVRRAPTVERLLEGRCLEPALIEQCARSLAQDIAPIDDIRSTAQYRLEISKNLLKFFLNS